MTAAVCLPARQASGNPIPVPLGGKCRKDMNGCSSVNPKERHAREDGDVRRINDRIMRITRVDRHDKLSLSAYIDHVLTHHFNQCEEIKSLHAPELRRSIFNLKRNEPNVHEPS